MKNEILFNYNIAVDELLKEDEDSYSFYIDYDKYYFKKIHRPNNDIDEISEIIGRYPNNYHKIIKNRFSKAITEIEHEGYVLLKINGPENNEIDVLDLIKYENEYIDIKSPLNRTNWSELWSNKVDYLEYQISELGTSHELVRKSFSYYVGLAENAISYFNLLKTDAKRTSLAHRRISLPLTSGKYNDPTDIIIDYRVRDYASYFKTKFFDDKKDLIKELEMLISKKDFTPLEYNLLFCRMLYPSYYFDAIREIFENGKSDEILIKYIENIDPYEKFLNDTYTLFSSKASMIKIDWLIKKS